MQKKHEKFSPIILNKYGQFTTEGECLLYPSKEHKTWDKWQEVLFKKGDIITIEDNPQNSYKVLDVDGAALLRKDAMGRQTGDMVTIYKCRYATLREKTTFYAQQEDFLTTVITLNQDWKFSDFKPFMQVLVRDSYMSNWHADCFSHYNPTGKESKFICVGDSYHQCVPYNDETKHLIGTNQDAPTKYITWK